MQEYLLTDKWNFPKSDTQAIRQLAVVQGTIMDYLEDFVRLANEDNPESIRLWELARGMNAAVEVYGG